MVPLDARLWGAAGLLLTVGTHQPTAWHLSGLQAAVLLLLGLWHFAAFRGEPADIARDLQVAILYCVGVFCVVCGRICVVYLHAPFSVQDLRDESDATGIVQDADEGGDVAGDDAAEAFAFGGGASGGPASAGDAGNIAIASSVSNILRNWPVRSTQIGGTGESLGQLQVCHHIAK